MEMLHNRQELAFKSKEKEQKNTQTKEHTVKTTHHLSQLQAFPTIHMIRGSSKNWSLYRCYKSSLSLEVHGVHVVRGAVDEDVTDQVEARHLGGEWRLHDAQSLAHALRDLERASQTHTYTHTQTHTHTHARGTGNSLNNWPNLTCTDIHACTPFLFIICCNKNQVESQQRWTALVAVP